MVTLHELPDSSSVEDMKRAYIGSLTAPMDDMWETGFIDPSPHWLIRYRDEIAGYYVANVNGDLLQFYLKPDFVGRATALFGKVIAQDVIKKAVVGTIDPLFLSLCLDAKGRCTVHTLLYERTPGSVFDDDREKATYRPIEAGELDRVVPFQKSCLAGEVDPAWLRNYSANLIRRSEMYVFLESDEWVGLGECRLSDSQSTVANLGMMVHPSFRRRGWATHILKSLGARALDLGREPICSTTVDNLGAQRAINHAGFESRHRILDVSF